MSYELYLQCIETIDSFSEANFLEKPDTWSLKGKLLELKNPPHVDELETFYSNIIKKINALELKSVAKIPTIKLPSENSHRSITESLKPLKDNVSALSQSIKQGLFSQLIEKLSEFIDYYKDHGELKKTQTDLDEEGEEDLPSTQELNLNDNDDKENKDSPYIITDKDNNNIKTEDDKKDPISRTSSM